MSSYGHEVRYMSELAEKEKFTDMREVIFIESGHMRDFSSQ